jgi:molybdopterin converting factor small subunit
MTSGPVGVSLTDGDVTIRYWAAARAAAGCDSESFPGQRVGDVLEAAAAAHAGLGVVLEVSTILLDGCAVSASEPLSRGSTLEVLPPFAGG